MKLTIKTKNVELEYVDDYASIIKDAKENIESLIKTMYEYEAKASPMAIHHAPVMGTVEEILNRKTK